MTFNRAVRLALLSFATTLALLGFAPAALATPLIHLDSNANTTVAQGEAIVYHLQVSNVGDQATDGSPLILHATMPATLPAIAAAEYPGESFWDCSTTIFPADKVNCVEDPAGVYGPASVQRPHDPTSRTTTLTITAQATSAADGTLTPRFDLYGGGAALPGGGACAAAPPGLPCAATADPTSIAQSPPGFGIDAFDARLDSDAEGAPQIAAGAHPYDYSTFIDFNRATNSNPLLGDVWPVGAAKDVFADLPPGFTGNPNVTGEARCTTAQLSAQPQMCPAAAQVGLTTVFSSQGAKLGDPLPVFVMVPPATSAARFGFDVAGSVVVLDATVRSGIDYGITVASRDIPEGLALAGTRLTFWGVPADPSHDVARSCPGEFDPWGGGASVSEPGQFNPACSADYTRPPELPFFRNPTSCVGPTATAVRTDSWQNPGVFAASSFLSHESPGYPSAPEEWGEAAGNDHCPEVPFHPSFSATPTTNAAESPSGLNVDLSLPQNGLTDPNAISESDLEGARVTLPEEMTVNPAQANGLGACTLTEIDLHGENTEPACPDSSKIGEMRITTPLLDHSIDGSVYLAAQNDNPFNSLLALYIVADDKAQTGTVIKLAGKIVTNPQTGQLETVFTDQPQLPFEHLHLELWGGDHAPLITPASCGEFATVAKLSPWASPDEEVPLSSSFTITVGPNGSPCPGKPLGFNPKLSAGTQSPLAGTFSPFNLRLTREDATQRLTGLAVSPPPGLLASLRGIPYCSDASLASIPAAEGTGAVEAASPSCPAASRLGTVSAGAGAGPDPFFVQTGRAYLAGPYKGAPLSMAIVTPALAGPFDLGNVVVRTALQIDPESARITAVSDPIPTIIHGIPLDLRDLRVNLDRPNFTLNPTSCDPMSVNATAAGSEGGSADLSNRFQVGECARLAFKPQLSFRLKGKTRRGGNPALTATLRFPKTKNANIARVSTSLPHSEFLAQAHIRTICTRVQYAAGGGGGAECPKGSVYGHARAFTPLLDQPLEGPVYLRSSNHPLPDLVASLGGQIHVDLVGEVSSNKATGGLRTTFAAVPDAPVSKFVLSLPGGSKSLLENSTDICRGSHRAIVQMDSHSGKIHDFRPKLRVGCHGPSAGKGRHHHKR
jgi:hypothetical protein